MTAPKRLLDAVARVTAEPEGVLPRAAVQALCEKTVKLSKADAINVNVSGGITQNIRFAANQLSTAGS
ncbi:MAG: TldD/PmbA family protein, partial [Gemmatimonadetes bacterium]|nr:TldD/PmbA family protein [Gemmatimonadota bacterium]